MMQQVLKARALTLVVVATLTSACSGTPKAAPPPPPVAAAGAIDRTVLPLAEPSYPAVTEVDARKATPPPRFEVKAPDGRAERRDRADRRHRLRPVERVRRADPHADPRAAWRASGLRYNRFHTTALCSPTRTALLTGRNHHVNNAGAIMELATGVPGQHRRAAEQRRAAGRDPAAERLQHGGLRQVPRDARRGRRRSRGPSTAGRRARASTSSTASSAARRTSGRPRSTTA